MGGLPDKGICGVATASIPTEVSVQTNVRCVAPTSATPPRRTDMSLRPTGVRVTAIYQVTDVRVTEFTCAPPP